MRDTLIVIGFTAALALITLALRYAVPWLQANAFLRRHAMAQAILQRIAEAALVVVQGLQQTRRPTDTGPALLASAVASVKEQLTGEKGAEVAAKILGVTPAKLDEIVVANVEASVRQVKGAEGTPLALPSRSSVAGLVTMLLCGLALSGCGGGDSIALLGVIGGALALGALVRLGRRATSPALVLALLSALSVAGCAPNWRDVAAHDADAFNAGLSATLARGPAVLVASARCVGAEAGPALREAADFVVPRLVRWAATPDAIPQELLVLGRELAIKHGIGAALCTASAIAVELCRPPAPGEEAVPDEVCTAATYFDKHAKEWIEAATKALTERPPAPPPVDGALEQAQSVRAARMLAGALWPPVQFAPAVYEAVHR